VFGNISLSRRARVVFPLDEHPLSPTTTAFRWLAMVIYLAFVQKLKHWRVSRSRSKIVHRLDFTAKPFLGSSPLSLLFKTDESMRPEVYTIVMLCISSAV
jgi:hypothetical protein